MNLYSRKQHWKIILFLIAVIIILASLWYSHFITNKIKLREKSRVELWSAAVQKRIELVNLTANLFEDLKKEERIKADLWAEAFAILANSPLDADISFASRVALENTTIAVLLVNEHDSIFQHKNVPVACANDYACKTRLKREMSRKNKPIEIAIAPGVTHKLYYNDSKIFTDLKTTLDDLKNTFISETVVNSASVPVILTDQKKDVIAFGGLDSLEVMDSLSIATRISTMEKMNEPLELEIVGSGKRFVFYEDSYTLKLLKYFPIFQLVLIALFLIVAYVIFSTFRKAEQNQVWVGMAKETAHQLGTPLSALMAWMTLLEEEDVDKTVIEEMTKDITRLNTVTDRFSKIGSAPELIELDLNDMALNSFNYLRTRISNKVELDYEPLGTKAMVKINKSLFSWVLENLVKNSVDAMNGKGSITISIKEGGKNWIMDLIDTGKGIHKSQFKTVFEPGFTTKKRGWGLGLSLTKRIVEEYHQGKIFILNSELNSGTTFRILLPRAKN